MSNEGVITEEAKRKTEEKPLTRQQQRYKERIETEAKDTYNQFTGKFFEFFIHHESPESSEVIEKAKQMNAQWKMYCKRMQLVPAALVMFENYTKGIIDDYHKSKVDATIA